MHCASKARSLCVPHCPFVARMTHPLSPSRVATPNHAFEGTACQRGCASLAPAVAAPQRRRYPATMEK